MVHTGHKEFVGWVKQSATQQKISICGHCWVSFLNPTYEDDLVPTLQRGNAYGMALISNESRSPRHLVPTQERGNENGRRGNAYGIENGKKPLQNYQTQFTSFHDLHGIALDSGLHPSGNSYNPVRFAAIFIAGWNETLRIRHP